MHKWKYFYWCLLLLSPMTIWGNSRPISIDGGINEFWLKTKYVSLFIDSSKGLEIDEVINSAVFESVNTPVLSKDSTSAYWLRFEIVDNREYEEAFRLEMYDFDIDEVSLFYKGSKGEYIESKSGYSLPFKTREIEHKNVSFQLKFGGEKRGVFYMRFVSTKVNLLKPVIKPYDGIFGYALSEYIFLGIFYGLVLFMILYNIVYFIILRRQSYLLYVFYACGILLFLMCKDGIGFQYLWSNYPEINNIAHFAGIFVSIESLLLFSIVFLKLKKTSPRLYNIILGFAVLRVIIFVFEMLIVNNYSLDFIDIVFVQLILVVFVRAYLQGDKSVNWILISFILLDITLIITLLEYASIIPSSFWVVYALNIGVVLQFLFMAIGMAEAIRRTYQDKSKAQSDILVMKESLNQSLEQEVKARTSELVEQKKLVVDQNNQLTSSVRYALNIQNVILPSDKLMDKHIANKYLIYQPKDIVSGDFYWFHSLDEDKYLIAVCDCTGHGVPGALMSMIGTNILNQIVAENVFSPNQILDLLRSRVRSVLRQEDTNNQDGMDIAICLVDKKERKIQFSGAKNSILFFEGNSLKRIRGNRMSIGGNEYTNKSFDLHEISFDSSVRFFLYTDGIVDQFGGELERKFGTKNLMDTLQELSHKEVSIIGSTLQKRLALWMENQSFQIDDMTFLGIEEK